MAGLFFILVGILLWAPSAQAFTPYYSYYDPIYDSGVVEDSLTPKGASLGDSVFGKSGDGTSVGGFLSGFKLHATGATATEYTDNAKLTHTDRKSDVLQDVTAGVAAESDWDRHSLQFGLQGDVKRYAEEVSENQNNYNFFTNGRLDITDEWSLNGNLSYVKAHEERNDPQETNLNLSHLRGVEDTGGGLGLDFKGYPFLVSAQTSYHRILFEKLDGEAQGFRDRDVSRYLTRISYPLTDAVHLFVQPAFSREMYDTAHDASGVKRDSKAYEVLGGIAYNVTKVTSLNLGVGEIRRDFDDPRLHDTQGLSVDGSMLWSPYEDFSLNATINRTIDSTTLAGVNDLVETGARLIPSFAITPQLIATGEFGADRYEFDNIGQTDHDYLAGAGLSYLWNDAVSTGINYRYRRRFSDTPDRDFYSNTIMLTLACSL